MDLSHDLAKILRLPQPVGTVSYVSNRLAPDSELHRSCYEFKR